MLSRIYLAQRARGGFLSNVQRAFGSFGTVKPKVNTGVAEEDMGMSGKTPSGWTNPNPKAPDLKGTDEVGYKGMRDTSNPSHVDHNPFKAGASTDKSKSATWEQPKAGNDQNRSDSKPDSSFTDKDMKQNRWEGEGDTTNVMQDYNEAVNKGTDSRAQGYSGRQSAESSKSSNSGSTESCPTSSNKSSQSSESSYNTAMHNQGQSEHPSRRADQGMTKEEKGYGFQESTLHSSSSPFSSQSTPQNAQGARKEAPSNYQKQSARHYQSAQGSHQEASKVNPSGANQNFQHELKGAKAQQDDKYFKSFNNMSDEHQQNLKNMEGSPQYEVYKQEHNEHQNLAQQKREGEVPPTPMANPLKKAAETIGGAAKSVKDALKSEYDKAKSTLSTEQEKAHPHARSTGPEKAAEAWQKVKENFSAEAGKKYNWDEASQMGSKPGAVNMSYPERSWVDPNAEKLSTEGSAPSSSSSLFGAGSINLGPGEGSLNPDAQEKQKHPSMGASSTNEPIKDSQYWTEKGKANAHSHDKKPMADDYSTWANESPAWGKKTATDKSQVPISHEYHNQKKSSAQKVSQRAFTTRKDDFRKSSNTDFVKQQSGKLDCAEDAHMPLANCHIAECALNGCQKRNH